MFSRCNRIEYWRCAILSQSDDAPSLLPLFYLLSHLFSKFSAAAFCSRNLSAFFFVIKLVIGVEILSYVFVLCGSKSRTWEAGRERERKAFSRSANLLHQQLRIANKWNDSYRIYIIDNYGLMPFQNFMFSRSLIRVKKLYAKVSSAVGRSFLFDSSSQSNQNLSSAF